MAIYHVRRTASGSPWTTAAANPSGALFRYLSHLCRARTFAFDGFRIEGDKRRSAARTDWTVKEYRERTDGFFSPVGEATYRVDLIG